MWDKENTFTLLLHAYLHCRIFYGVYCNFEGCELLAIADSCPFLVVECEADVTDRSPKGPQLKCVVVLLFFCLTAYQHL